MKRFAGLMVLMALTTPAYAGSYSFVVAGHHIHVEASRHCRALSCVSWSEITRKRDRDDTVAATADPPPAQAPVPIAAPLPAAPAPVAAPTPAAAPAPVAAKPAAPAPQSQVAVAPVQAQPAPVQQQASATPALRPVETRTVVVTPAAPPPVQTPAAQVKPDVKVEAKVDPKVEPKVDPNTEAKPRVGFDLKPDTRPDTTASLTKAPEKPADKPTVVAKPAPSKTTLQSAGEGVEAPIGDWQTEGRKGLVRIEPCGTALCGYMINTSTNAKGETVLINMKPKANSEWSGSVYSRASGNTYYAIMTMKRPNTLRVEACVVGRYFCSGNNWTRIASKPDDMLPPRETREASADPAR